MCLRKLLLISYLEHETNDWVRSKINFLVDPRKPLLAITVKRRKLEWFRHVHQPRQLLQNHPSGHLEGWATPWSAVEMLVDNIKEWTSLPIQELLTKVSCRKRLEEDPSCPTHPHHPR